jgi:hypothetical protein
MQNPGSDAGVFVWAGDANIPYRTINPDAGANVTPRKTLHAPGISLLCTRFCKYTMVYVDNFKKKFVRVANRTDNPTFHSAK